MAEETQLAEAGQDTEKPEIELLPAERAAVILLLLGEEQAAEIISYMSPREVQALGAHMVAVADLSQEAVNMVLDDFVATIKQQTNIGLEFLLLVFHKPQQLKEYK